MWAIIVLMTVALIGSIGLQAYWINWSIKLNENQFDKLVFTAMHDVSIRLEEVENYNPPSAETIMMVLPDSVEKNWQLQDTRRFLNLIPLAERINLEQLDSLISQEFLSRGVDVVFNYGVLSNKTKSFVIANGHYLVEGNSKIDANQDSKNSGLFNSRYKVPLFRQGIESPGELIVHFPQRNAILWWTVWKPALGSLLFTSIILFSFVYTVNVVFRQKKISEMKTDFINNMTHEFKTPIATISLAADAINNPSIITNEEKIKRFLNIIKQENKRMNSQVEKVLQMAQIDKNDINLTYSPINLHNVIQATVENISLQVEAKGGKVKTSLLADYDEILGDITHVTNIIHNLIDNANKYTPSEPEITISTKNVDNEILVSVKDNGIGISKEARKLIFDKFYRVHTGNVHDVKGFGLGLSYVKAMVEAHKGTVEVRSELGKGSEFILHFPLKLG